MKLLSAKASVLILALAATSPGWCTSIAITNPSFESPSTGSFTTLNGNGWTVPSTAGGTIIDSPGTNGGTQFTSIPDGTQVAIMNDYNGTGTFYQVLSADVIANTTYTLTFYAAGDKLLQYDGFYAALEACNSCANGVGTVLNSLTVTATQAAGTGVFTQETITYNSGASPATLGQPLEIFLSDVGYQAVAFDDFQLSAVTTVTSTPEPGTWLLLLAGIGGLGVAKRRAVSRAIQAFAPAR